MTPWTAARQASLSITNSQRLLKLMSIELVMPSNHLILCHPLLLLPSIFPHIRWPKYWSFSFSINPSSEYSGLISFRIDWRGLLVVQGTLKSLLQHHSSQVSILWCSAFFTVQLSHPYMTTRKSQLWLDGPLLANLDLCWMWVLNHKESWGPKNWCFWIVVLEKTLESPLDSKEINPVNCKGNSTLSIHCKNRHWSWSSNALATRCEDLTHWKRPWCWETLKAGGEGEKVGLMVNTQKTKIMASGPITSWQIDGETVREFIFGGSKITVDSDCSHEIKRCLLLGRKAMTNLDSVLKSRDITLQTKVCLVKAMGFPVVMYGCESWTIKKAEHQRTDAFELWCWRRLLGVP